MSKVLILLSLLSLISCEGDVKKPQADDNVGDIRAADAIRNPKDNEMVQKICRALRAKESMLGTLVQSAQTYNFDYTQRGCETSQLPAPKNVTATVKQTGTQYYFSSTEHFGFPNIDTTKEGVMKLICNTDEYSLASPIIDPDTNAAYYWTTNTSAEYCRGSYDAVCLHIQTGTTRDNYNYKIHTNEWIRYKTGDNNLGFFTERRQVSSAGCSKKKTREMKAVLR